MKEGTIVKKAICVICTLAICLALTGCDSSQYKKAMSLYENGEYEKASEIFEELGDYENSSEMALSCKYTKAEEALASGNYEIAISFYESVPGYRDSESKLAIAKKKLMFESFGDVIQQMTTGVWFYYGGSDSAVNRLTFSDDMANITQFVSDGNGVSMNGSSDVPFIVDGSDITLTLVDGSEQVIPYTMENDTLVLDNDYLTPADIDADLQGYWGLRTHTVVLGMTSDNEYIYYFNRGKVIYESAAKAYGGKNGEYYYYGPDKGTYTVDESGLNVNAKNSWQFAFNVIDGKAVFVRCGNVCSQVSGFKGESGYRF